MSTVLAALLLLLPTAFAGAQNILEFGVKAGVNHSFANSLSDGIETSSGIGFELGGFAQFGLFDMVALETEVTFDNRSFSMTSGGTTVDVKTTSINIPVLLRIGLPLKMMLELGPQYSHYLSTNNASTTDGQGFAVIGVIWKPAFSLQFDLRYLRGLSTISTPVDSDVNVNVTQFSVGYAF